MIYQNFNFSDSFSNASGNRRNSMVISRLAFLIGTQFNVVKDVVSASNIRVSRNITKRGLARLIIKNKNNDLLIENLSALIVIDSKVSNRMRFSNVDGEQKGQLFKKIGNWFKAGKERRQARRLARQGKDSAGLGKKLGGLLKDNKKEVAEVGGSLLGGLFSRGGGSQLQAQTGQTASGKPINPYAKAPMSLGTKIGIGVGLLAILGVGIYFMRKKK